MRENAVKSKPFIHVFRRNIADKKTIVIIKTASIFAALLMCGLFSNIFSPGSFFYFYSSIFEGTLSSFNTILATLWNAALLLLIAAAITPAFKMKFWNIGAEGQVLMGAFGAAIVMKFAAPHMPNALALLLMLLVGIIFAAVWAFIPAFFKAMFNTNETLFTLMMNYIAMGFVAAFSYKYRAVGKTSIGIINQETHQGWLPTIGGYNYIINIIVVAILVVGVWIYLKYSKHGYEISVLGGSVRTAEYVGINVKKTIMRTLVFCGILCGVAGFLIVSGASWTVSENVVKNNGFTAVMVSWLGHFNPLEMVLYAFLNSVITTGSNTAAGNIGYSGEVSYVLSGLFFLVIITSEFFINFRIKFNFKRNKNNGDVPPQIQEAKGEK